MQVRADALDAHLDKSLAPLYVISSDEQLLLFELADRIQVLQVEALCWCGKKATHNARTVDGTMVTHGEQVVVGDVAPGQDIAYEVLCRRHHMREVTARSSKAAHVSTEPLPFT